MKLVNNVFISGKWYGPEDEIPEDVASLITNPQAWQGGVVPSVKPAGGSQGDAKKAPARKAAAKKADG